MAGKLLIEVPLSENNLKEALLEVSKAVMMRPLKEIILLPDENVIFGSLKYLE